MKPVVLLVSIVASLSMALSGCAPSAAPPTAPAAAGGGNAAPGQAAAPKTEQPAAPAPTRPAAAAPTKIVVGFSEVYEGAIPMWVADEAGIFKKNGLDVDLQFTASSTGISALLGGQIQLFQGGGSEALSAVAEGADLVAVGNIVPVYPYVFMVPADVKSVADLKGKKVGVSSPGSTSDIATRVGLKDVGLDPDKDVSIVAVGSSQNRTAALMNGSIQGGLDQPPGSLTLEKQGLHSLFDMASLKLPVVNNGLIVQRGYLNQNRATIQKYVDSIVEGIARAKKDKDLAVKALMKNMKLDDKSLAERTWQYATTEVFPDAPEIKPEHFKDSVEVLGAKNPKVKDVDLNKMIDRTLVQSAVDRGVGK